MITRRYPLHLTMLSLLTLFCLLVFPTTYATAQQPVLPTCAAEPDAAACQIAWAWDADDLAARLSTEDHALWLDGDMLLIATRIATDAVYLDGALQTPLHPLPLDNTWGIAVRIQRVETAVLHYYFIPLRNGQRDPAFPVVEHLWTGPAVPEYPYADTLTGELSIFNLTSAFLTDPRRVQVYLPPDHDPTQQTPVVYLTDGSRTPIWAALIEPHILNRTLPPVILVGVYAAGYPESLGPDDDPRAAEYLGYAGSGNWPDPRFLRHENFFMTELMPWAEEQFGAANDRTQRAIFGTSNGAGFAMLMAQRHPDQVSNVIAFSIAGWGPEPSGEEAPYPMRYYTLAGTLESGFHGLTTLWYNALSPLDNVDILFEDRVGGHSEHWWWAELPPALLWLFGDTPTDA
ncbi:MAG: esterase family protein [Anaerolineae bacterium]|nr:esterase family protein [Anaerolineae bacterium]